MGWICPRRSTSCTPAMAGVRDWASARASSWRWTLVTPSNLRRRSTSAWDTCSSVERWSGGAVERWNGGTVERWSGGAVERWSGGTVERQKKARALSLAFLRSSAQPLNRYRRVVDFFLLLDDG